MTSIRSKKAFTLIEMIIVVIIMFTVYYLVFTNNSFGIKEEKKEINLLNLREFLLSNFIFTRPSVVVKFDEPVNLTWLPAITPLVVVTLRMPVISKRFTEPFRDCVVILAFELEILTAPELLFWNISPLTLVMVCVPAMVEI